MTLRQQVKQMDYDRYLCSLFAPVETQADVWAVLAFAGEVAKTAQVASEPAVGAIRLKWWQEVLEEAAGEGAVRAHPVAEGLRDAVRECPSMVPLLTQMVEARMADIEHSKGFVDEQSFNQYVDATAGNLHVALAMLLDADAAIQHEAMIRDAARAYALMGLLRALPYHASEGVVRWPIPVLLQCGVSPAAIEQGVEVDALRRFALHWLEVVEQGLAAESGTLPRSLTLLRLLDVVMRLYARSLRSLEGDVCGLPARIPSLPLRLWWAGR